MVKVNGIVSKTVRGVVAGSVKSQKSVVDNLSTEASSSTEATLDVVADTGFEQTVLHSKNAIIDIISSRGQECKTSSLAATLGERGKQAHDKFKDDPTIIEGSMPKITPFGTPAEQHMSYDREYAKALKFLGQPSAARDAFFKEGGIDPVKFDNRRPLVNGELILDMVDKATAKEITDVSWTRVYDTYESNTIVEGLNTRRLSDVQVEDMVWLWDQRFPLNEISLVIGDCNLGKTWLVLDIMARVTTGRPMPGGCPNPFTLSPVGANLPSRDVLWVSAEDSDSTTIKPRFIDLKGDCSRLRTLQTVGKKGKASHFNLSSNIEDLSNWLREHPSVKVICLDPLSAYLGKVNSNSNSEVRDSVFNPLSKLCQNHKVSIIGIDHLNKGVGMKAAQRHNGSVAMINASRSTWMVLPDTKQEDRRFFVKIKVNAQSEKVGGLAFRVGDKERPFYWEEGRIDANADQILQQQESRVSVRGNIKQWLLELLKDGPVDAKEIEAKAKTDGFSPRTLDFAKKEIGVLSKRNGKNWVWHLKEVEQRKSSNE